MRVFASCSRFQAFPRVILAASSLSPAALARAMPNEAAAARARERIALTHPGVHASAINGPPPPATRAARSPPATPPATLGAPQLSSHGPRRPWPRRHGTSTRQTSSQTVSAPAALGDRHRSFSTRSSRRRAPPAPLAVSPPPTAHASNSRAPGEGWGRWQGL